MSSTNLVIFVSDYPFGPGEPFLEEELKILSDKFEKIYLVNFSKNKKNIVEFYVPPNAEVVSMDDKKNYSRFTSFFSFIPLFEILLSRIKHKKKINFRLMKLIYAYWIESVQHEKLIKKFLFDKKINLETTVFYSYWCDVTAISLANIKQKEHSFKYVIRLHGWDLYFERHSFNFLPFRERIFNNAQNILPISNDGRKYILDKKLSIRGEKIITARLGVKSLKLNCFYANEQSNQDKTFRIITLSHINPIKSLYRLVDALALIDNFDVVWTHIGYGDGVFDVAFKEKTAEILGKKNNIQYHFKGRLLNEQVYDFLENEPIDVIVNCSVTEGVPVSLMEAMSAGIPAIAFNIGGIPEIVNDTYNGFLLDHTVVDHASVLAKALRSFQALRFEDKKVFSNHAVEVWREKFNSATNFKDLSDLLTQTYYKPTVSIICCEKCLISSEIYPDIILDKYGVCDICKIVETKITNIDLQKESGYLPSLLNELKVKKGNKQYDCILGISGGVDSAYLALKAKEWGLNPLLVHIDTGWNSELAVDNIKLLIDQLGFDLYTVVIDWNEIQDIVRSFMRASVIDIDWANELSAQASLYKVAQKFKIKHILTGHQVATEGWMPSNIVHFKLDLINFKAIHRKFGERKLVTYPTIGVVKTYYYEKIRKIKFYNPLDYIPYVKKDVKIVLQDNFGWRDYGHKHYENIFTRFYQGYILPKKFNTDKRVFHYSAMIVSGQLTKKEAEELLKIDPYNDPVQFLSDKDFVIKKLGFDEKEFDHILNQPPKQHTDYPSYINIRNKAIKILSLIRNNR